MPGAYPVPTWNAILHQSATNLSATGNTGIIAYNAGTSATLGSPVNGALFPLFFVAVGNNMTTDETNILTIEWYADSAGNGGIIGTTTFDQLTAGNLTDLEVWPGDVSAFNAARDMVPMFPYMKIVWTLAGTTKSMGFTIYASFVTWVDSR